MTQDHTKATPVCYRHPGRETMLRCSRCNRPICSECSIDATVGQRCPHCVASEGVQREVPKRSIATSADAPTTKAILAVTVGMLLLTGFGGGLGGIESALAQANQEVSAGEWWRIFTPVLLHANLMHIFFNMYALWILGPQIERGVGSIPFLAAYLASAGVGGAFFFHLGDPGAFAVGASGAIFGLFGIWFNWAVRRRNTAYGRYLLNQIMVLLLINAAIPFLIRGIAWEAHLGGLMAGFLIGEIWSRVRGADPARNRTLAALGVAALAVLAVLI